MMNLGVFAAFASRPGRFAAGPPGGGGGSGLPSWLTTNAPNPGDWYQVPNTNQNSIAPSPLPAGDVSPRGKSVAWNSYSIDTRDSKLYSAANGGHADYSGNEVDCLSLETESPGWFVRRAPTAAGLVNTNVHYADGRPGSRHSYYAQTVDVVSGRLLLFGGSRWNSGNPQTKMDSFILTSDDWNAADTHPDLPNAISASGTVYGPALCTEEGTGDVFALGNFNLWRWQHSSNTWSARLTGIAAYGNDTASAYDSTRGRFFFCGGETADHHTYTVATNTLTSQTLSGGSAGSVTGRANAMVYVPDIDAYLVRTKASGGTVYQIDASTFVVTTLTTSGGGSVPDSNATEGGGPYNKFLYAPNLKGCIYCPVYGQNAWFLRVHA